MRVGDDQRPRQDAHRAGRREDRVQHRAQGRGLQPARAGRRRRSEPRGSPSSSGAGASCCRRSSSSARVAFAPRANITQIDNDISAWFAQGRSRLPRLRAVPRRVRRQPHAHRRAQGRLRRSAVLAADARLHPRRSPATSSASTRSSASPASRPRRPSKRSPGRAARSEAGLDVRPLIEAGGTQTPDDVRRRALKDDLIRGDLVSDDGTVTAHRRQLRRGAHRRGPRRRHPADPRPRRSAAARRA